MPWIVGVSDNSVGTPSSRQRTVFPHNELFGLTQVRQGFSVSWTESFSVFTERKRGQKPPYSSPSTNKLIWIPRQLLLKKKFYSSSEHTSAPLNSLTVFSSSSKMSAISASEKVDGFTKKSMRKAQRQRRSQGSSQYRTQSAPVELSPLPQLKGKRIKASAALSLLAWRLLYVHSHVQI